MSIFSGRIYEIFAAVSEEMLLIAVYFHLRVELSGINVHAVLTLFREGNGKCHNVARNFVAHIL